MAGITTRPKRSAPAERAQRRRLAPYGWWPLIVIIAVSLVDRLESSVLSAILPLLQEEWGFSDTAGGSLSAAISITGTAVALPAGYLADRANRTRLLAVVVALWSVITLGSALAISFAMFYVTRLVLAAADSIDNPSQVSLLADYYSVELRAKVMGWHRMVAFAGAGIGTVYGGLIGNWLGWRWVFLLVIVPGLVVAWWCYRLAEPRRGEADAVAAAARGRHRGDGDAVAAGGVEAEAADEQAGGTGAVAPAILEQPRGLGPLWEQVKVVARIRSVVILYTGLATLFFALFGILFWLPTFYHREYGLDVGTAALVTAAVTTPGVIMGTGIGGLLGRRWHGVVRGGRVVAGAGALVLGSLVAVFSLLGQTIVVQSGFLLLAATVMSIAIPNLQAAIADCLPANQRGVGFSLLGIFTTFGAFGPMLVGVISDATGSLRLAFGGLLVPMVLGGMISMLARSSYEDDADRALDAAAGR
jgi:MFS family permease